MEFKQSEAPQLSPEWFKIRLGKITASRLGDWLSVSKAKSSFGKPLRARLDYERELLFERTFLKSFEKFVTPAMEDGINFEETVREAYARYKRCRVTTCGAFYNDYFVASPDGLVGKRGLLEIKVLRDKSFADVMNDGVIASHWKQIQGQLWATNRSVCDYVAANLSLKLFIVIRVPRDETFIKMLASSVQEEITPMSDNKIKMQFGSLDTPATTLAKPVEGF